MRNLRSLLGTFTITLALGVSVQAQSFLTNGLVAYYPFNGNANDQSGNGNDGVAIGVALITDRLGNLGSAYRFDGTASSYINAGDRAALRMSSSLTISAWVYQTGTTGAQMVVSKEGEYWFGTWRSSPSDPSTHKMYVALTRSRV